MASTTRLNRMKQSRTPLTALVDASSAIILCKADLHVTVSEMYDVVMPRSVYGEITGNSYPGSEEYKQLLADNKIRIQIPPAADCGSASPDLPGFGQGERDVINLYHNGRGDFVIVDDGAAARYCRREKVRFINGLLVPVIIRCTGRRSDAYCQEAFNNVMNIGRYSRWVIDFAKKCGREELSFFLP